MSWNPGRRGWPVRGGLLYHDDDNDIDNYDYQARARNARACALRALGLLLADGSPTVGGGKIF